MPAPVGADHPASIRLFQGQIVPEKQPAGLISMVFRPSRQHAKVVGGHAVGMDLEVGMQQRAASRGEVILGDAHIAYRRLPGPDAPQIAATVQKAVVVGGRIGRADFNEMLLVE